MKLGRLRWFEAMVATEEQQQYDGNYGVPRGPGRYLPFSILNAE